MCSCVTCGVALKWRHFGATPSLQDTAGTGPVWTLTCISSTDMTVARLGGQDRICCPAPSIRGDWCLGRASGSSSFRAALRFSLHRPAEVGSTSRIQPCLRFEVFSLWVFSCPAGDDVGIRMKSSLDVNLLRRTAKSLEMRIKVDLRSAGSSSS